MVVFIAGATDSLSGSSQRPPVAWISLPHEVWIEVFGTLIRGVSIAQGRHTRQRERTANRTLKHAKANTLSMILSGNRQASKDGYWNRVLLHPFAGRFACRPHDHATIIYSNPQPSPLVIAQYLHTNGAAVEI